MLSQMATQCNGCFDMFQVEPRYGSHLLPLKISLQGPNAGHATIL